MDARDVILRAPAAPGVYLWKNARGKIIYVGKAKDVRKRLIWYLDPAKHDQKTRLLMGEARNVDWILTDGETEALVLECTLIKEHEPKYNVNLKDGKKYPYIKVELSDEFPRVCITRLVENDGGRYYGPYPEVEPMRRFYNRVQQLFGLRTCGGDVRKKRPCLKYHIGRCVGPCTGKVGKEEYGKLVDEACMFFSGKTEKLLRDLKLRMKSLSDGMEYEKAAKIRDLITAIEKSSERQKAEFSDGRDADVLGYAKKGESAGISLIIIRGGKMLSHFFYRLGGEFRGDNVEGLSSFVKQYYSPLDDLPSEIILRDDVPDKKEIEKWLSEKSGSKVKLTVPSRGVKSDLISLAEKNAKHAVELEEARLSRPNAKDELVRVLSLSAPPKRIEGYDISNIGGAHAVGSMVVFEDSVPEKKSYRRFKIKTVPGANDPVMIREVIKRRRQHPEWSKPDLVLVDGGRAQLNTALAELSGWDVPVISLAKEEEEVYTPEKEEPIRLPKDSPALLLLMRVRDEAHRFAVSYHRTLRSRALSD